MYPQFTFGVILGFGVMCRVISQTQYMYWIYMHICICVPSTFCMVGVRSGYVALSTIEPNDWTITVGEEQRFAWADWESRVRNVPTRHIKILLRRWYHLSLFKHRRNCFAAVARWDIIFEWYRRSLQHTLRRSHVKITWTDTSGFTEWCNSNIDSQQTIETYYIDKAINPSSDHPQIDRNMDIYSQLNAAPGLF